MIQEDFAFYWLKLVDLEDNLRPKGCIMKAGKGLFILTIALSAMVCLALAPSAGATSLFSSPATQWPAAHYATQRSEVAPAARKAIAEGDDLVVSVDDFTYTGLIKASATNPYAPPPRRPPVTKKGASSSPAIVKKK